MFPWIKKVLIANQLALCSDKIFSLPEDELFVGISWIAAVCYTLQIYFDFSGYSDMAIGLGRMFGFHFNENFNNPYAASSIQDFWRRWHISLSSWFRDYLYIPLGGNRKGKVRTYINQLIVFILCGFWHGAQWTFLIWGLYHGLFLCFEKIHPVNKVIKSMPRVIAHIYSLVVIVIGWVFFKCDSLSHALTFLGSMFGTKGFVSNHYYFNEFLLPTSLIALVVGIFLCVPLLGKNSHTTKTDGCSVAVETGKSLGFLLLLLLCIIFIASGTYNPFIYFRF